MKLLRVAVIGLAVAGAALLWQQSVEHEAKRRVRVIQQDLLALGQVLRGEKSYGD